MRSLRLPLPSPLVLERNRSTSNANLGHDHKKLRKTLNPVFATRHIRDLLPIFHSIAHKLQSGLTSDIQSRTSQSESGSEDAKKKRKMATAGAEVDMLDWVLRTVLDLIGLGGLGYEFGALEGTHDPYNETARHLLCVLSCPLQAFGFAADLLRFACGTCIGPRYLKSASSLPSCTSS